MEDTFKEKISCCRCLVCEGDTAVTNGDELSSVADVQKLFSIFLQCLANNNDDFDGSSILSENVLVNYNVSNELRFCATCEHALVEWDKLYENRAVISQNLDRIRFTLYAKILNSSNEVSHVGNSSRAAGVRDDESFLFVQKILEVKDQICKLFKPRVSLHRIACRSASGTVSKDLVNNSNNYEDEFEAFSQAHNENDFIEYCSEPESDPLSVEMTPESESGGRTSGPKIRKIPDLPYKVIGPGKFLYADKYIFFFKTDKYECAECSAVIIRKNSMFRHIREVHMKDAVKPRPKPIKVNQNEVTQNEVNYLGYHITVDEDGYLCCPVCDRKRKKRSHMYQHIREAHARKKQPTSSRTAMAVIKPEFALKSEHSSCVPVKVEGLEIPPAADVSKCDSNSEKTKTFSDITENHGFGKTAEYEVPPTETVHRRSLRERRRAAAPVVDLLDDDDDDDDVISDVEQVRANDDDRGGRHDDNWESNSEDSEDDDEHDATEEQSRPERSKTGGVPRKRNRKDTQGYSIVSDGPNEWIYADEYRIIFKSEEERYYCGSCPAVNSRRAGLMKHIRDKHIDGQPTRAEMVLRPTGPNEYIYRDRFKITVKNDAEWYCDECGIQRKDKTTMMNHIRDTHIVARKGRRVNPWRTFEEVSPNEFLYHGKYSFRFDPVRQLYLCSLCEYTCHSLGGVLPHIRGNHFTEAEKQHHTAVEVAPGEYLYAGKYKIIFKDGRFCCTLCTCTREELYGLYPHFRLSHPDPSDELPAAMPPQIPMAPEHNEDNDEAQKPDAPEASQSAPLTKVEQARLRRIERRRLGRAISRGWKLQENGNWIYKEWEVMEIEGKYKCSACDVVEEDRRKIFLHVQSSHAKERVTRPPVRLRPEEGAVLEYLGIPYTYDPIEKKYACSLCHVKKVCRRKVNQHIKYKHIHPEKFICDICGQELDCRLVFQQHRARHEGPKHACKHCDKKFTDMNYLRTHMRIHIGEDAKKHQCEFCGKKFYTQKELRNHRSSHTGEKPFPCDLCGESFSTTFKRRDHRKKFHGGLPQKPKWKPTEEVVPAPLIGADQAEIEAHAAIVVLGSFAATDGEERS